MKFVSPSWDEIYTKSIKLAQKIRRTETTPFDSLVGVSRGGLVLTRILSDLLDVQNVNIIKCEYYSDFEAAERKPVIAPPIQADISGKKILLVDDVADTGDSLVEIRNYLSEKRPGITKVTTIYVKPWSKSLPDYYAAKTSAWIIFPWELHESLKSLSNRKDRASLRKTGIPLKYAKMIYKMNNELKRIS